MNLLVIVVNDENDMEKVIRIFVETGICGATIIDSVGMGRVISNDIPIFAGLHELMHGSYPQNKTIFSVIKEDKVLEETKKLLIKNIDFNKPGVGIFFSFPIADAYGLAPDCLKKLNGGNA